MSDHGSSARAILYAFIANLGIALARVGSAQAGEPRLQVLDARGKPMAVGRGFDHFAP